MDVVSDKLLHHQEPESSELHQTQGHQQLFSKHLPAVASYNLMVSRSPLASMQPFGITTSPYLITPLLLARSNYCSVAQLYPTPCDPVDCSMPGFPVLHYLPEFAQTHIHRVNDAHLTIRPSAHLSSPSPALKLSQHQGLFP